MYSNAIKSTRKIVSEELYNTLKIVLESSKKFSEVDFRDLWFHNIRNNSELFPEGWYIPPPHGIGVIFATDTNPERINLSSIRPKEYWPQEDIYLDKVNGMAFLYAGFVNKKFGIMGDFEMTVYFGDNELIQKHFKKVFDLIQVIVSRISVGMELSEVAIIANKVFEENNVINTILSITDQSKVNMGHTIPFSYETMTENEKKIFDNAENDWNLFCQILSQKRKFINISEKLEIQTGMALTFEPRLKSVSDTLMPQVGFHVIILFHENGEKEVLTNFESIFKLTKMNFML